jgi:DnaK suppressor protein
MKKLVPKKPAKKAPAKPVGNVDFYQKKLEIMRDDLLKTVSKKREEALPDADVGDEGDVAARSVARDLVFELTDNEKHLLDEVEAALRRVEKGVFGLCEACGDQIKMLRLKFMPYARYCIKCQARFEHS